MSNFNSKSLNLPEIVKRHCDIESEIECQLYSDPEEKNHLDFTPRPPLPKYQKVEVKRNLTAGMYNLIRQCLP